MIHPHQAILTESERSLLETAIDVARASLDRFERPRRMTRRWRGCGHLVSDVFNRTELRTRGRCLEVAFSGSDERLRFAIREYDRDLKAPILAVEELVPIDRRPTAGDPEEIEATLVRWARLVSNSVRFDAARRERCSRLIGALVLAAGADPTIIGDMEIHLPSMYRRGSALAGFSGISCNGSTAYQAVRDVLESSGREAIMTAEATASITTEWWNQDVRLRQSRIAFDLSTQITTRLIVPSPMEVLRILS